MRWFPSCLALLRHLGKGSLEVGCRVSVEGASSRTSSPAILIRAAGSNFAQGEGGRRFQGKHGAPSRYVRSARLGEKQHTPCFIRGPGVGACGRHPNHPGGTNKAGAGRDLVNAMRPFCNLSSLVRAGWDLCGYVSPIRTSSQQVAMLPRREPETSICHGFDHAQCSVMCRKWGYVYDIFASNPCNYRLKVFIF